MGDSAAPAVVVASGLHPKTRPYRSWRIGGMCRREGRGGAEEEEEEETTKLGLSEPHATVASRLATAAGGGGGEVLGLPAAEGGGEGADNASAPAPAAAAQGERADPASKGANGVPRSAPVIVIVAAPLLQQLAAANRSKHGAATGAGAGASASSPAAASASAESSAAATDSDGISCTCKAAAVKFPAAAALPGCRIPQEAVYG